MIVMGHVGAPFGVKGWVNVHPYTVTPGALLDYQVWWLGGDAADDWRRVTVDEAVIHGRGLIARLEGSQVRETAMRFKGLQVAVRREDLPESGSGEYYWVDLVGMNVVNRQGVALGTVRGLTGTGANDVLEVSGDRLRLIPFVGQVIDKVDREAGVITVDWGADY